MNQVHMRRESNDIDIWRNIVDFNEYKLPDRFLKSDLIIDVGAHIGAFSYAALERGAGKVIAIEADPGSFFFAEKNLLTSRYEGRVVLLNAAVWRSDVPLESDGALFLSENPQQDGITNFGGTSVFELSSSPIDHGQGMESSPDHQDYRKVTLTTSLDALIDQHCGDSGRVKILKLDCEGSEWPILFSSTSLDRVDAICGEYHEFGGEYDEKTAPFALGDLDRSCTIADLKGFLMDQGFAFVEQRHLKQGEPEGLGLFFAWRYPNEMA